MAATWICFVGFVAAALGWIVVSDWRGKKRWQDFHAYRASQLRGLIRREPTKIE